MTWLEFPYGPRTQVEGNVPQTRLSPFLFPAPENIRGTVRIGGKRIECDYYLLVESVGSVVHHWLLCSRELYSGDLRQLNAALCHSLFSKRSGMKESLLSEHSDTQGAIRFLNAIVSPHGFCCHSSHRGDEITLDGESMTIITYVDVTIWDPITVLRSARNMRYACEDGLTE
jgi:hypothetical protein